MFRDRYLMVICHNEQRYSKIGVLCLFVMFLFFLHTQNGTIHTNETLNVFNRFYVSIPRLCCVEFLVCCNQIDTAREISRYITTLLNVRYLPIDYPSTNVKPTSVLNSL